MIQIQQTAEQDFPLLINLSLQVFKPQEGDRDDYHEEEIWREHYQQNGLVLGAYNDKQLVGYIFFYDREKDKHISHCWLACVAESSRGKGVLKMLMQEAQSMLKDKGYIEMTINTYPEKFPAMFHYLTKYQFELYKEEQKEWQGHKTKKTFFRKTL